MLKYMGNFKDSLTDFVTCLQNTASLSTASPHLNSVNRVSHEIKGRVEEKTFSILEKRKG